VTTLDRAAELERSAGRAPKPPLEEQRGRLQRARAAMERHGLEGLVVYGSAGVNADPIRYLSGYVHVFPGASSLLLLPLDGDPVLLVDQGWHLDEARRMSFVDDVRALPAPGRTWLADELRRTVADALSATGTVELEGRRFSTLSGGEKQRVVIAGALAQAAGAGGEIQLTDAMVALARTQPFYGLKFEGRSFDCGSKIGFLTANVAYALERTDIAPDFRAELARVLGDQ